MNANNVSGAGEVQITGAVPSSTYTLTFEPFTSSAAAIALGTVSSDASGNINSPFTFPQKGTFAGIFNMQPVGANSIAQNQDSGVDNTTTFVFNAPLQRASTVAPAIKDDFIGTDPLASGSVQAGGGHVHVVLTGALPNAQYFLVGCGVNDSSSCGQQSGPFSTDASGNVTFDMTGTITGNGDPEVIIEVFRGNDLEYVTGFTVQ